jgi:hypothetical protein
MGVFTDLLIYLCSLENERKAQQLIEEQERTNNLLEEQNRLLELEQKEEE